MKNVLRIILLLALFLVANKVLSSDFNIEKTEDKTVAVLNK